MSQCWCSARGRPANVTQSLAFAREHTCNLPNVQFMNSIPERMRRSDFDLQVYAFMASGIETTT
jgi:hypothetical protein